MNGTHQFLGYADVNLLCDNINIIEKNREPLLDASKEVSLKANTEKMKYMFMSCHQSAGKNHNTNLGKKNPSKI
jgi:hypothetical protein